VRARSGSSPSVTTKIRTGTAEYGMRVVCMLPARNAAGELPEWFASVSTFADAVVALDDGSTDDTAAILEAHPLVEVLLRNPRRDSYVGWDDSRNRNELLAAAGQVAPDWLVGLDSDERIPEQDGLTLREFLERRAVPGFAYGFRNHRMIGDLDHYDVVERSYRVFAYRPGDRMPEPRLHFMPIAASVPRHRWLLSDLRIQHLGALTAQRRRARRAKYHEVDPLGEWDDDYGYTDAPPAPLLRFRPRRLNQPVMLESRFAWEGNERDPPVGGPVVTVAVIVGDAHVDDMRSVVESVQRQAVRHPVEVLVIAKGSGAADDMVRFHPSLTVVTVEGNSSPGAARNVALRLARGDYLLCFDAPAELAPGALAAMVDVHDRGNAFVAGAVRNLTRSAPGWASYLDGAAYGSFSREPLLRIGGFDSELAAGVEAHARDLLVAAGQRTANNPLITFGHAPALTTDSAYVRARYTLGRLRPTGTTTATGDGSAAEPETPAPDTTHAREQVRGLRRRGALADWVGTRVGAFARRKQ
jgi:glycosyltransferase involved in cell wall biosynthesis